jgi:hypothetical protein
MPAGLIAKLSDIDLKNPNAGCAQRRMPVRCQRILERPDIAGVQDAQLFAGRR